MSARLLWLLGRIGAGYKVMGVFGLGFMVGGMYCATLASLGKEAIRQLTGVSF
jgi:hypothetical protein